VRFRPCDTLKRARELIHLKSLIREVIKTRDSRRKNLPSCWAERAAIAAQFSGAACFYRRSDDPYDRLQKVDFATRC
jgi:hypothetical protein